LPLARTIKHPDEQPFDKRQGKVVNLPFNSGGIKIYAVIETGGKQYKVSPDQKIEVERLNIAEGDAVVLDRVLLISDGEKVITGNPIVKGARVKATSLGEFKGDKVIAFKYKSKVRYRRKKGHRQIYTRLLINKITKPRGHSNGT